MTHEEEGSMPAFDSTEFSDLLARHHADLEGITCHFAAAPCDRDDLRQEIAIALWQAMPRFRGESSERTYVVRIARHRAFSFAMRHARRRALFAPLCDDLPLPQETDAALLQDALATLLARAMDELPVIQRRVLMLSGAGLDARHIALRLGATSGSVRVALHRARRRLRDALTNW
jgi:RNA polymerase sigma-70 factor (ECF subfamily)